MDIVCDAVLVGVPAYLVSRMRRIQRKRKIVIVFLCCGSVLSLLVIVAAEIVYFGPFAETEGKDTFINFLLHLSVRFPSLYVVKLSLIPGNRTTPDSDISHSNQLVDCWHGCLHLDRTVDGRPPQQCTACSYLPKTNQ